MSSDEKFTLVGDLYVPVPDLKRGVKLTTTKLNQDIDAASIHDVIVDVSEFLESEAEWFYARDPVYGEEVALHRSFLADLQGVGYAWHDLERIKLDQQQRKLALMQAGFKGGFMPPVQNRRTRH